MHGSGIVAQQRCARRYVLRIAAEYLWRILDRRAALPLAGGEGILALGDRVGAEIAADEQGVGIDPLHAPLAFGQIETILHEAAGGNVEFAQFGGVLAAIAQRDHALGARGRQAAHALVHPFAPFGLGERVDVEDGFPLRIVGAVAVERGDAHDPARVGGVLPEVDQAVAGEADPGNAVLGIEDRQRLGLELGEARIARERLVDALVLGADPRERGLAAGFL